MVQQLILFQQKFDCVQYQFFDFVFFQQKIYLNNNNKNKKEIPNNKEKINSLLSLVNIELEKKDKYFLKLKKVIYMFFTYAFIFKKLFIFLYNYQLYNQLN